MAFLRKCFAWVLLGILLLAEIGVMLFVVVVKRPEAEKARKNVESLTQTRDKLKVQVEGDPKRQVLSARERIKILEKRKGTAIRELGECLLFLWRRGDATEGLFKTKELAAYDVHPWQAPPKLDVFKAEYQAVYNREVAKLEPLLAKVGTSRGALRLADPAGFMQAKVTIGDIFVMQKEFWLKKEIVEIVARSNGRLPEIEVGRSKRRSQPERHAHGKAPAGAGTLTDPIPVRITVWCEYPRLDAFIEDLLSSPLSFRINSITNVQRVYEGPEKGRSPAAGAVGAAARPLAAAGAEAPGPAASGEAAGTGKGPSQSLRRIGLTIVGEAPDLCVDIHQVTFLKPRFGDKAKVQEWLDAEDTRLKRLHNRCTVARKSWEAARREGSKAKLTRTAQWIDQELSRIDKELKEPTEGQPTAITVVDRLGVPPREYVFADPEKARAWLENRFDFELLRVEALQNLWQRVRQALNTSKTDTRSKAGVVVTFRPLDHFDGRQKFDQPLDDEGHVRGHFGLVTFRPEESIEGVKRAAGETRP